MKKNRSSFAGLATDVLLGSFRKMRKRATKDSDTYELVKHAIHKSQALEQMLSGFPLLWGGFGTSSVMGSLGYPWYYCQAVNIFTTILWGVFNVNPKSFVRGLFFAITELFFSEQDTAGAARIPETGPIILACAPHANQFMDLFVSLKAAR